MSTPANIAIQKDDGNYDIIYVHNDGMPEHLGHTLLNHYNTIEKAAALVALGDLSAVHEKLEPTPGSGHSFDNPEENVTVAYHRDRQEELNIDTISKKETIEDTISSLMLCGYYVYVWRKGEWYYAGCNELTGEPHSRFTKLSKKLRHP